VEVVVNNAGWDDFMPFIAASEEFWDKILDINFKGALRVTQSALPGMIERRFGRIINIGSDAGRVGSSLEAVYSGAKGGIIAFTKTWPARSPPRASRSMPCARAPPIPRRCASSPTAPGRTRRR
jgi:NAD(P)-dependent dehydrogenase (short-subunit alcohol dehydrogenase family)